MNASEMVSRAREGFLFDNTRPFTWSDDLLDLYLNEAEREACRRSSLLIDKSTASDSASLPLCSVQLVAEQSEYTISPKIVRIRNCVASWDKKPIYKKTEEWLDEKYPTWRTATGDPIYFLEERGKITVVPEPVANDTQSVSSITRSGTTATVTLSNHGYDDGDTVKHEGADQAEYNVTTTITKIDDDSYSYTVSGSPATPATGTITATLIDVLTLEVQRLPLSDMAIARQSVTSITRSGAVATVSLTGHGYSTDDTVTHYGADQPEYNITATITVSDADTYTFPVVDSAVTPATGTIIAATSGAPEIVEEYHLQLIDWMVHLALGNRDQDSEHLAKSNLHESRFEQSFGPKLSAITETNRRRRPKNKSLRSKEFGFS